MMLPALQGLVRRRILVNFRVHPEVIARQLPAPFRPKLVGEWAMAGVCLIRLEQLIAARLRTRRDQSAGEGVGGGLGAAAGADLSVDIRDVPLDGRDAHDQLGGDDLD